MSRQTRATWHLALSCWNRCSKFRCWRDGKRAIGSRISSLYFTAINVPWTILEQRDAMVHEWNNIQQGFILQWSIGSIRRRCKAVVTHVTELRKPPYCITIYVCPWFVLIMVLRNFVDIALFVMSIWIYAPDSQPQVPYKSKSIINMTYIIECLVVFRTCTVNIDLVIYIIRSVIGEHDIYVIWFDLILFIVWIYAPDSQPQVIKFTSCLPMVGASLRLLRLPPLLKLVAMIYM
jgi:hypothetical protein